MPELAEVEFFRKQWDPGIGREILQVRTHPKARIFREAGARAVCNALTGRRLLSSHAHGKQLCFGFSGNTWLGIHLGMAGRLTVAAPEIVPGKHEHLVLICRDTALVFSDYRMFGCVKLYEGDGGPPWWSGLPPQPQEDAFDAGLFRNILEAHPRRPLKALLLDQSRFPGIGNWMADEILWRARIHPESRPAALPARARNRLFKEVKAVCREALEVIGTNWGDPPETWLFQHRWKRDGVCPVSGKPLEWITVGGRTTCFSPAIQKKYC